MHCYREQKVQKNNIFIQLEKGAEIHLYTNYFFILAEHFPLALIWIGAVTAAPAAVPPLTAEGGRTPATVLSLGAGYPARFLIR